jgi:hypothetical protein
MLRSWTSTSKRRMCGKESSTLASTSRTGTTGYRNIPVVPEKTYKITLFGAAFNAGVDIYMCYYLGQYLMPVSIYTSSSTYA